MIDPIRELRTRAEILQHNLQRRFPRSVDRLRSLAQYRSYNDDRLLAIAPSVRRHECLSLLAIELGFEGWPHAKQTMSGGRAVLDFGTMLYPLRCGGHLNLWYRSYPEAVIGRRDCHGYLLAYRRQFFVVEGGFIEALGLDPHSREWESIGFDWVKPADVRARTRLYGELIRQLTPEGGRQ